MISESLKDFFLLNPLFFFLIPFLSFTLFLSLSVLAANHSVKQCRTPCALRSSCSECTSGSSECMWCSNMRQCVDSNAYVASFPYGQCMEWYTMNSCPRTSDSHLVDSCLSACFLFSLCKSKIEHWHVMCLLTYNE